MAIYLLIYYVIRTTRHTNKTRCEKRKYTKNTNNKHYEVHKNHIIKSTSDSLNCEIWPLWNFTHNNSLIRFILSRSGAITEFQSIVCNVWIHLSNQQLLPRLRTARLTLLLDRANQQSSVTCDLLLHFRWHLEIGLYCGEGGEWMISGCRRRHIILVGGLVARWRLQWQST